MFSSDEPSFRPVRTEISEIRNTPKRRANYDPSICKLRADKPHHENSHFYASTVLRVWTSLKPEASVERELRN